MKKLNLTAHKQCPICGGDLASYKSASSRIVDTISDEKQIFMEWACSIETSISKHIFSQTSSLEGALLLEDISFLNGIFIEVNYVKQKSTITFVGKTDSPIQELVLDKILELDYPKLENIGKKIKNMAFFL